MQAGHMEDNQDINAFEDEGQGVELEIPARQSNVISVLRDTAELLEEAFGERWRCSLELFQIMFS